MVVGKCDTAFWGTMTIIYRSAVSQGSQPSPGWIPHVSRERSNAEGSVITSRPMQCSLLVVSAKYATNTLW